jgi:hypothetical protein
MVSMLATFAVVRNDVQRTRLRFKDKAIRAFRILAPNFKPSHERLRLEDVVDDTRIYGSTIAGDFTCCATVGGLRAQAAHSLVERVKSAGISGNREDYRPGSENGFQELHLSHCS